MAYQPQSRRPIADALRQTAKSAVSFCVAKNVSPDTISYLSMVAATAAAICFWQSFKNPWLFVPAAAFCYLRLWFNMLDGMVAMASGKASWRGEILNDLPDRFSDVIIFAGVAHSGWGSPFPAYWAAIGALLTAYVGMFGQAVGVQREFSGVMSKPWRMVALHIGSWIALGLSLAQRGNPSFGPFTILDWTCLIIIAGCLQTIAVRLQRIMTALEQKKNPKTPKP